MNASDMFSTPIQGIESATAKIERHAQALAAGRLNSEEFVGLIEGKRAVEINLATVRVADNLSNALLDILA